MITKSRLCAFNVLKKCAESRAYSNIVLSAELDRGSLSKEDAALATELVYGTISKQILLDFYIGTYSAKPIEKLDTGIKVILRMSFYQLLFLNSTPDYAVCNEAVYLARRFYHKGAEGFVNAILRSYLRNPHIDLPKDDTAYGLSVNYSVSKDIAKLVKDDYGIDAAREILKSISHMPPVYLTVNTIKTGASLLASRLGAEIVNDTTLRLEKGNLAKTEEFKNGLFIIQDIASSTAVEMLAPCENDTLIDMCAAPGGKSLKAAIMMNNKGKILSFDIHENKLSLIENSAKRLGVDIIKASRGDAAAFNEMLACIADKIICDVPCSGLGVMAKKPEIRYKSLTEIESLYDTQRAILENAVKYLKHGGKILYSTCTINKKENQDVVNDFLSTHKGFNLVSEKILLPTENNDGFYMAVIVND